MELTAEPDGILKGCSPVLELSLSWDGGWPRLYDPATGAYLEGWREVWYSRESKRTAEQQRDVAEVARLAAEMENQRLREELRRLRGESDG